MLFVIVEAIQHLDVIGQEQSSSQRADDNDETEINTLEYVRDNFEERLVRVRKMLAALTNNNI